MRIWWVLPVSSRISHTVAPRSASPAVTWVTARLPWLACEVEPRMPSPRSVTSHDSMVWVRTAPWATHRYARSHEWSRSCAARPSSARLVLANISRPEVALSMRCTTCSGVSVAGRPMRRHAARIRSIAVPVSRSSYGTDEIPAGLSITTTWASSWTTSPSRSGSRGRGAASRTSTASPPRMRRSIASAAAPPTSTLPVAIHFFTTDHGSPLASRDDRRQGGLPAAAAGTVRERAPASRVCTAPAIGRNRRRGDRVAPDPGGDQVDPTQARLDPRPAGGWGATYLDPDTYVLAPRVRSGARHR